VCSPVRAESKVMSNHDASSTSNEQRKRHTDQNVRRNSDRAVAIFFAIIVAILVLGYLIMTKLADDSRAEGCMIAHRKKCAAIEWPSD
jgi:phage FluMu gp28-like protein